jgi:hypothetical protein
MSRRTALRHAQIAPLVRSCTTGHRADPEPYSATCLIMSTGLRSPHRGREAPALPVTYSLCRLRVALLGPGLSVQTRRRDRDAFRLRPHRMRQTRTVRPIIPTRFLRDTTTTGERAHAQPGQDGESCPPHASPRPTGNRRSSIHPSAPEPPPARYRHRFPHVAAGAVMVRHGGPGGAPRAHPSGPWSTARRSPNDRHTTTAFSLPAAVWTGDGSYGAGRPTVTNRHHLGKVYAS